MKYVLITGATSGIGYEMAKVFAREGYALVLVGRQQDKLDKVKETVASGLPVVTLLQDLARPHAAREIIRHLQELHIEVEILINNAGVGYAGRFEEATEEILMQMIEINMTQLTLLCKYMAAQMKQRRRGTILNVASTGAYCPGPYIAAYYATKSYVLSLSEALHEELKSYKVHVATLCPGATRTAFQKASGRADTKLALEADFVAQKAYEGILKKKRLIVPGVRNKWMIRLPKRVALPIIKRYQKATLIQEKK